MCGLVVIPTQINRSTHLATGGRGVVPCVYMKAPPHSTVSPGRPPKKRRTWICEKERKKGSQYGILKSVMIDHLIPPSWRPSMWTVTWEKKIITPNHNRRASLTSLQRKGWENHDDRGKPPTHTHAPTHVRVSHYIYIYIYVKCNMKVYSTWVGR